MDDKKFNDDELYAVEDSDDELYAEKVSLEKFPPEKTSRPKTFHSKNFVDSETQAAEDKKKIFDARART